MGMPGEATSVEDLRSELRSVLRSGLPLTADSAGDILPEQRLAYASAQHPHERASRISAAERALRSILTGYGRTKRGKAARVLFGADRGLRGTTLTYRREEAAKALDRHVDHLRKHIEPRILDEVAFALYQENLRYKPAVEGRRPPIAAHEDAPVISDGSYTEQEEMLCRVWEAVYGYRAEIIAVQRRVSEDPDDPAPDLEYHVDSAKWQLARLLSAVSEYLDAYGDTILHGETPFSVEGLVALAGWHGGLGSDEARRLRLAIARDGREDRAIFLGQLSESVRTDDGRDAHD